jgi:hypothetical protein
LTDGDKEALPILGLELERVERDGILLLGRDDEGKALLGRLLDRDAVGRELLGIALLGRDDEGIELLETRIQRSGETEV